MAVLTAKELMKYLPHRYPFFFIDRVEEVVPGERAVCIKNVTINEPFFQGHFPDHPVMPGVLQIEAMAQAAIAPLIAQAKEDGNENGLDGQLGFLGAVNKAKFRRQVEPGDVLRIEVEYIKQRKQISVVQGTCYVGDDIASQAEITVIFADSEAI
ncbi:3-hydroxyacyl-ACP dehydratase FabZ [Aerococcaceae bacterium DSM 111176]|nr:3-hydroxyacyl-ACP dehydratase FabZ [Aerococcaceae bacterium DSM 111176]